jgi:type IV secretion system protein TrbC
MIKRIQINTVAGIAILLGFLLTAFPEKAAASSSSGLPWETPLQTLEDSITGPVAYGLSILGIVGAGGALIFVHSQIGEFIRMALYVVLVAAFAIAAKNTAASFGWGSAAVIGQPKIEFHGVSPDA